MEKRKFLKTDETIFYCDVCGNLIINEDQKLFQKTKGVKKCTKCLLSKIEIEKVLEKQIEATIN